MFVASTVAAVVRRIFAVRLISIIASVIGFILTRLFSIYGLRKIKASFQAITFRMLSAQLMSLVLIVCLFTTSTPAAAPTILLVSTSSSELGQDIRYTYLSGGGLAALASVIDTSTFAVSLSSGSFFEWVSVFNPIFGLVIGKVFGKKKRQQEPEAPQRIVILPTNETNTLTVLQGEKINLTAIGLNRTEQPIGGLEFKWTQTDTLRNLPPRPLPGGAFEAKVPGTFAVIAESYGKAAQINITVNPNAGLGVQRLLEKGENLDATERGVLNNLRERGLLTVRENSTKGRHNPEEEEALSRRAKQKIQEIKALQAERIRQMNDPNRRQPVPPNQQNPPRPPGGPRLAEADEMLTPDISSSDATAATTATEAASINEESATETTDKPAADNPAGAADEKTRAAAAESIEASSKLPANQKNQGLKSAAKNAKAKSAMVRPPDEDFWDGGNYWVATEPYNEIGNTPGSAPSSGASNGNFRLAAPIISLPGRGLDVNLNLYYNSRLWSRAGNVISYDPDKGNPAPGWNLGFGKMVNVGTGGCMMVDADGTRRAYNGSHTTYSWTGYYSNTYNGYTTDGSFIDYHCTFTTSSNGTSFQGFAKMADGTVVHYNSSSSTFDQAFPTHFTDVQGNYMTITYVNNQGPNIQTITDTLGRTISFNYDGGGRLVSVVGPAQNGGSRVYVRLHYNQLNLNYAFNGLTADTPTNAPFVLDAIYYPGLDTGYWFGDADSYSSYGMLAKIKGMRAMSWTGANNNDQGTISAGLMSHQEQYNFPLGPDPNLTDAPLYTTQTETWDLMSSAPAVTTYAVNNTATEEIITVTAPDGTKSVQTSYINPGAWNDGVYYKNERLSPANAVLGKMLTYMQPGEYGSFRPARIETTDEKNQTTAVEFDYTGLYNQVALYKELNYANQVYRETRTYYDNHPAYLNRHIFFLPKAKEVIANGARLSRIDYEYDNNAVNGGSHNLTATPGVVMHNYWYNPYTTQTHDGPTCLNYETYYEGCFTNGGIEGGETYWDPTCNPYQVCTQYEQVQSYDPNTVFRGNVTKTTVYENAQAMSGAISYDYTYDIAGNQRTATTNCCQQMGFTFTINTQYSQAEIMTKGSSDPNSPHRMTQIAWYDFNTGNLASTTDFNGRTTNYYYDGANRHYVTDLPTGARKIIYYILNHQQPYIAEQQLDAVNGTSQSYSHTYFNGRGQVRLAMQHVPNSPNFWDAGNWNDQEIMYDQMGRKVHVSMPFNNATGNPGLWTSYAYDYLGRITQVTAPDGSTTQTMYNEATRPSSASSLPGQTVRSRDAWGRERWARTDDFGRMVETVEPDPNGSGAVFDAGNMPTQYTYDALDQLTQVNQGAQLRAFRYDSLGRLKLQKLAETSGTINDAGQFTGGGNWSEAFTYDSRSNLIQRLDARGVKTYYDYTLGGNPDPLNRLQSISYDKSAAFGAAAIVDASPLSLNYMTTGDKTRVQTVQSWWTTEENVYDAEGRISDYKLTLPNNAGNPLVTSYLYDTLSRLTEIRYPQALGMAGNPRKVVTPGYDDASRLKELKVDNQIQMSEIVYNPLNQVIQQRTGAATGNSDVEIYTYDQQTALLTGQAVIKANTNQHLLNLSYDYQRGASNGNTTSGKTRQLTKITNNLDHNRNRIYEFDALGRLRTAKGGAATGAQVPANWTQAYTYDRYGNRTQVAASGVTANNQAVPTDGLPTQSYDQTTNRITTAGYEYDPAGNLTRGQGGDGSWQRYLYDAAGRLTITRTDTGVDVLYNGYTSSRQRLFANDALLGLSWYVWGGSQVIAEYKSNTWGSDPLIWKKSYIYAGSRLLSTFTNNGAGGETLEFHHPDRLGTKLVTNNTANTSFEQSTLPFGTSLDAETSGTTNQRFTSYDRSTVAQLDYAVNRSYSAGQGRFTQPDPIGMSAASLGDPQSLNMYAYVGNNPINYTDPSGLNECPAEFGSCGGGFDWNNPQSSGGSGFGGGGFDSGRAYEGMSSSLQNSVMQYEERLQNTYDAIDANRALQKYIDSEGTDTSAFKRFSNLMASNLTLSLQVTVPFIVSNIDELEKQVKAGNISYLDSTAVAQCARLPIAWQLDQIETPILGSLWSYIWENKHRMRLQTSNWVMGDPLKDGTNLPKGLVLATFKNGKYSDTRSGQGGENHTVIFLGWDTQGGERGMRVIQQMSDPRGRANFGFIPFNANNPYYRNAGRFSVVMIKN